MAIRNEVNGAWEDIEELRIIGDTSAYQTADHANAEVNGAWEEVWSNVVYTFNTLSLQNTTLNGDGSATVALHWAAQSGCDGYFYIMGDFQANVTYTLTFTYDGGYYGSATIRVGGITQLHSMVTGSNTVTITPTSTDTVLMIGFSASSESGGSVIIGMTDIAINNRIVKLV